MSYVVKVMHQAEIIIEKSRFIALLCPLTLEYDFDYWLRYAQKTYKDARHYTYALRSGNLEKASDDGEPQNTAGLPLLNLLKTHNLVDVTLIVVRYFGGKKLGAGRLLRTYVEAGKKVISSAQRYEKIPAFNYLISVPLSDYDRSRHYLEKSNVTIISTDFSGLDVVINVLVSASAANSFESNYNIKSKAESMLLVEVSNE